MVPQPFNAILDEPLASVAFTRLRVPARGWLFHAGQPKPGLYFVNAGYFRTSVGSAPAGISIPAAGASASCIRSRSCSAPAPANGSLLNSVCAASVFFPWPRRAFWSPAHLINKIRR